MKIKNINSIIESETTKIINEILGLNNDSSESEISRQKKLERDIEHRGVDAPQKKSKKHDVKNDSQKNQDEADEEKTEEKKDSSKETDNQNVKKPEVSKPDKSNKGTKDSPKLSPPLTTLMNPSFEDVLDGIALIRGGKSAKKNTNIRKALKNYFDELTAPEKRTLSAFLFGSAQVLSDYETDDLIEPDDVGVKITTTKDPGEITKVNSKNKVISKPKNNIDNPVIVVGERANKDKEMMILASYRRN